MAIDPTALTSGLMPQIVLTNATTITAKRTQSPAENAQISFEVIEYF